MAMQPNRTKFRKVHRGRIRGTATAGHRVAFGDFGLQSLDAAWISGRQLEAGRVACSRAIGGQGKIWIRVFPHKPISAKPAETRMGTGKGEPEFWVAIVKPGTMLFEISGVDEPTAKRALARVAHKLPIRTRFVARRRTVA